jgi:pyridoxal phosphate enzyme (YggS family)
VADVDAARIAANLERVRERMAAAGRDPADVTVCAAVKYLPAQAMEALAEGGIEVVGENRAQALIEKQEAAGRETFDWHFIGALQSRKVRDVAPRVSLIHSVASESALKQLEKYPARAVLVQVNVAGEEAKEGIPPGELGDFIARSPVPVKGLMTMPPFAERAEDSRRWFAALAELAAEHGLDELSMGTTQDFEVAVSEGATIVRLGTVLYA